MTDSRIAVAGLGNAAQTLHLPALRGVAGASLVGGFDPDAARRDAAHSAWGMPVFASLEEMLRETRPGVLLVCSPPRSHRGNCEAAFLAGCNVICEKPFATNVADAFAIAKAAHAAGRQVALNHEFRVMPAFAAALDGVRRDGTGVVFAQAWQLMDLPPWKEAGWRRSLMTGVLYEAGIHLVDYLLAAFGEKPVAVTAQMSSCDEHESASDAVALLTLEFARGRLGLVVQHRLCVGETQYFEARLDTRTSSYRVSYGGRARISAGLLRSRAPHVRVELGSAGIAWAEQGHVRRRLGANPGDAPMAATRRLIEQTLSAFANGTTPPAPDTAGCDVMEVLAAAYLSAAQGRRVSLADDRAAIERYQFE